MAFMRDIQIEKLDSNLRGIGYSNDKIIFIPNTIPGEIVNASITKEKKKYLEGTVNSFIKKSEKRVEPRCPYYQKCGGCDLEHVSYEESILWKKNMLEELFLKSDLWKNKIEIMRANNPWNYRNKVSLKVINGKLGFYENQSHELIEIATCAISEKRMNDLIHDFSLFSFQNGELTIRVNHNGELFLNIKTDEEIKIEKELVTRHKIAGIFHNSKLVYGEKDFYFRNGGILYQVSMNSFFQVNREMSEKLFFYVRNVLKDSKNVLDLYCGVGTLGFQALKLGIPVTGIEVVKSAVLNAISSAKLNHFEHYSYHLGKVEDILFKIKDDFDTIIVDPPRNGLDKKTRQIILERKPLRIIYVSCNPITLIRDLKEFHKSYEMKEIKAFDMFPYTRHVECVALLSLKEN